MTTPAPPPQRSACPIRHGPPVDTSEPRVAIYGPEFAADPHAAYRKMRKRGPVAAVDIAPAVPATLVTDYREALRILNDPRYPADPRGWQQRVPPECPALPTLRWRPDALRSSGEEHSRLRRAISGALDRVDQYGLDFTVAHITTVLINGFCEHGYVDLLDDFAIPLVGQALNWLLGLSPETGKAALDAIMVLRAATDSETVKAGNQQLITAMADAVMAKRLDPAADVTLWLIGPPDGLNDAEATYQLAMLYATGSQPTWNLIANILRLMLTDDEFGGRLLYGALSVTDAIDEVLFTDPPLATMSPRFPQQMQIVDTTMLPPYQPVLISPSACNNNPAVHSNDHLGNRSHLAWGAGIHACPARSLATIIATKSLTLLLDALTEIQLAVPDGTGLQWLASPFHRALTALPVTFSPCPPLELPLA